MKLSRRTNTIILWAVSIGLLVGMVITFTPTLGLMGSNQAQGATVLRVNGEPVTEFQVSQARQNPLFSAPVQGEVREDINLLLVDQLVREEVLRQEASRVRVSNAEVRQEVNDFRESSGVAGRRNDQAYLQLIGQNGFTDEAFRDYIRQQLRLQKYEQDLIEGVEVSEEEVETFYLANRDAYQSEEQIRARVIVVDDQELASDLYERAQQGEEFAELASEYSLQRADRAGALGAPAGETEPQPVGRLALPDQVAAAAFALQGSGMTEPIPTLNQYYIVQVEEYIPSENLPFDEVADRVREDALNAKLAGVVSRHIDELVEQANVEIVDTELAAQDYQVAQVGDEAIMASDLAGVVYASPQIQQNLTPEFATLITGFFKPTLLESLIDRKLAYLGASDLGGTFFGTEAQVAQQALSFVSRDVEVSDEEIVDYYEANQQRFTLQAEASVLRYDFADLEEAQEFREAVLSGEEIDEAAGEANVEAQDLGTVYEGQLQDSLDRALFGTDGFEEIGNSGREISDVLAVQTEVEESAGQEEDQAAASEGEEATEGEEAAQAAGDDGQAQPQTTESYVVLIAQRVPERVQELSEVEHEVERSVLDQQRAAVQEEWLAQLREEYPVRNLVAEEQARREQEATELLETEGETQEEAAAADEAAETEEAAD